MTTIKIVSRAGAQKTLFECAAPTDLDGKLYTRHALEEGVACRADLREANLREANLRKANLCGADLRGANLREANLREANLREANLREANLREANLRDADLREANLREANLRDANLRDADLRDANLRGADLRDANLRGADLCGADLRDANLRGADLCGADLRDAKNARIAIAQTRILPDGDLIGWKRCRDRVIVKLSIPAIAKRSHAFGRKCRAEFADVLEVIGAEIGYSLHDGGFEYVPGKRVTPDLFDDDWLNECSGGIHFFITREEAEAYQ